MSTGVKKTIAKKLRVPSKRTPAVLDEICARLSTGETMRSICRDERMPNWQRVYEWCDDDAEVAGRIARAREVGHDAIAEEALGIADDGQNDYQPGGQNGEPAFNAEHVQRSKLRVETRLKLLAKWSPKKYGEAVNMKHSGTLTLESLVAGGENENED